MSAAFALDFSGPPVPCDYPRCILGAFHDGDHAFAPKEIQWSYDPPLRRLRNSTFTVLGADKAMVFETCGSEDCLLHFARHHLWDVPLMCSCPQREYTHEASVHSDLKHEAYNPKLRWQWPWSLVLSHREAPAHRLFPQSRLRPDR